MRKRNRVDRIRENNFFTEQELFEQFVTRVIVWGLVAILVAAIFILGK